MRFSVVGSLLLGVMGAFAMADEASSSVLESQSVHPLLRATPRTTMRYCDSEPGIFKIDKINLTPNPPSRGQSVVFDFSGYLEEPIPENSYVEISLKLGFFNLLKEKIDLCSDGSNGGLSCPIPAGSYERQREITIPGEIPSGDYTVNANFVTSTGRRIACIIIHTTL